MCSKVKRSQTFSIISIISPNLIHNSKKRDLKKGFSILVVSIVIAGVALSLVGMTLVSQAAPQPPMARKIVVFSGELNEPAKEALVKKFDAEPLKELSLINAMVVLLPPKAEKALADHPGVLRVDNDDVVFALKGKPQPPPPPQPDEMIAWGVDRIDAELAWTTSTGAGVKVAILDTGIDIDHPDLKENIKGGVNVVGPFRTDKYNDDNGHGTHVAGIVAALDNAIGVVGVAPNAELYAVKAFNRKAIGFDSDIIDGIDWSINNTTYGRMDVINISFGGSDNASLHQAIQAAYNAGIVMVAAAGNEGTDFIHYPARYSKTIAVSATADNDELASFSSYASDLTQVEAINLLAAPGKDINSTWNNGGYYVGSGTSMAAPHVVGTAALVIASGVNDVNNDGRINDEIMNILKNTAEDLGTVGNDIYFGYGLVDAEAAVIK